MSLSKSVITVFIVISLLLQWCTLQARWPRYSLRLLIFGLVGWDDTPWLGVSVSQPSADNAQITHNIIHIPHNKHDTFTQHYKHTITHTITQTTWTGLLLAYFFTSIWSQVSNQSLKPNLVLHALHQFLLYLPLRTAFSIKSMVTVKVPGKVESVALLSVWFELFTDFRCFSLVRWTRWPQKTFMTMFLQT